jgi:hypothetical protein
MKKKSRRKRQIDWKEKDRLKKIERDKRRKKLEKERD